MIVGFQGEPGAFSEEAARTLFGEVQTRGYRSFEALVDGVSRGEVTRALLPCENTIAGSIARAYDLLYAHPQLAIVGETTHRIEQTLVGIPGATIEELRTVASHPVALDQCRKFFARHPALEAVVVDDTAGAVRDVVESGDRTRGAIGPALAAARYGGAVLERGIADEPDNFTRFFVIAQRGRAERTGTRATLSFVLPHAPGSLHRALGTIAERSVNLRSLVARPRPHHPFEYVFHADVEAVRAEDVGELTACLGPLARVLGRY